MSVSLYSVLQRWQEHPTGWVKYWGGVCSSTDVSQGLSPGCSAWFLTWHQESACCLSAPLWQLPSRDLLLHRGRSNAFPPLSLSWCKTRKAQAEKMHVAACPLPPSGSKGERGRKEGKNHSAPRVSLSPSSWWGAAASLPIRSLQKRWAHLIWLGLSPSDSVCN